MYNETATDSDKNAAADVFIGHIKDFAIYNSLIGLGMFILGYISTETFNYSALRQIFKIRSLYFEKVLNQDVSWYDLNSTGDFSSRISELVPFKISNIMMTRIISAICLNLKTA